MVGFRLSEDYERRLEELAKAANLTPGTLARRVVIAFIETQEDSQGLVSDRLTRIERYMLSQRPVDRAAREARPGALRKHRGGRRRHVGRGGFAVHISVGKVRRGASAVDYYHKLSREDYYLSSNTGRWWGNLAVEFGLSGEVLKADFCQIHNGFSPKGEALSQKNSKRRPAFDMTHSLVKDACVLATLSDQWRKRITDEVANPAIEVSLQFLQREACYSRRGKHGVEEIKGSGFVAACFDHIVSREVDGKLDPQLHRHIVVGNTCRGPDGVLRALDGEYLYHFAKTAAALATVEEAYQLQRLGFELERTKARSGDGPGRSFSIIGIPNDLRDEDSRRSQQILDLAGENSSGKKSRPGESPHPRAQKRR